MHRCTTPRSTRHMVREGTHSSSRGRDAVRPTRRGSSASENRASNTCSPTFAPRGEMPCSTAFPERACVTGSISADRPAGVKTTGRAPSGGAAIRSARSSRPLIEATRAASASSDGTSAPSSVSETTSTSSPAMRHTSALTPNPVPRYSPPAPAVLATRVAVVSGQEGAPDADKIHDGGIRRSVEERGERRQGGPRRKHDVQLVPQLGGREGPGDELVGGGIGGGGSRNAQAPAVAHPEIRPCFFSDTG